MQKPIGEILVEEGYITRTTLEKALELQKTNNIMLGEALMTIDALTKGELIRFLSRHKDNEEVKNWANQYLEQDEIDSMFKEKNKGTINQRLPLFIKMVDFVLF